MKREENGISAACFGFLDEADSTPSRNAVILAIEGIAKKK